MQKMAGTGAGECSGANTDATRVGVARGDHIVAGNGKRGGRQGLLVARRQRSEQYLTWSQSRSHFLRHLNGSWQWAHCLDGSWDFSRIFMAGSIAGGGGAGWVPCARTGANHDRLAPCFFTLAQFLLQVLFQAFQ